jgi:hypothetical protein
VAWVDDELGADAERWAGSRARTLLLRTSIEKGITEEQAEVLLDWAKEA